MTLQIPKSEPLELDPCGQAKCWQVATLRVVDHTGATVGLYCGEHAEHALTGALYIYAAELRRQLGQKP
jgi:hypothetical protein